MTAHTIPKANTSGNPKIPDVDTLPCPARVDAPHALVNVETRLRITTLCSYCRGLWTELDALARRKP